MCVPEILKHARNRCKTQRHKEVTPRAERVFSLMQSRRSGTFFKGPFGETGELFCNFAQTGLHSIPLEMTSPRSQELARLSAGKCHQFEQPQSSKSRPRRGFHSCGLHAPGTCTLSIIMIDHCHHRRSSSSSSMRYLRRGVGEPQSLSLCDHRVYGSILVRMP